MSSIYASRLPHYVKDWDLRSFFQRFGRVASVRINRGGQGMKSAFVNFVDASGARNALQNHHPVFLGRRISVSSSSGGEVKPENPYTYSGPSTVPTAAAAPPPPPPPPSLPVRVKQEPGTGVVVKQEPGVLRPGGAWGTGADPFHENEFSVSAPPRGPRADPFQGSAFSVSKDPFDRGTGPQVATVFSSPPKPKASTQRDPKCDRPGPERPPKKVDVKPKKKVMSVGNLKPPRSAAEFVESQKKLFEDKKSFADDSPEEPLSEEIIEEKKRIVKVLNSGAPEKLQRLQLIGKKKADAIVAYRRLRGKFRKIEDLAKISLFGEQFMQKFKEANFIG